MLLGLAFLTLGVYEAVTGVYRAAAWDHMPATLRRCEDLELRTPTCYATFNEGGEQRESQFASGWLGTPRIGEQINVVVSADRRSIDVSGWRAVVDAVLPLGVGLVVGAVAFPWAWLRRRRGHALPR